jgi:membrane protease YdiL (CAAX protease family)
LAAWILFVVAMSAVVLLQQASAPPPAVAPVAITAPDIDATTIYSKLLVKLSSTQYLDPNSRTTIVSELSNASTSKVDEFRAAIAIIESSEPGPLTTLEAITRLSAIQAAVATPSASGTPAPSEDPTAKQLVEDIVLAKRVYSNNPLTPDEETGLRTRHGWFGDLLITHGQPATSPDRARLVEGGLLPVMLVLVVLCLLLVAFVGCAASIVVLFVKYSNGTLLPAFVKPIPGGSVFLEMVPVFILGFLGVKVLTDVITTAFTLHPLSVALPLQWSLIFTLFWPVLRGMPFREFRHSLGWHSGKGVFREIGAGVVGYLAGLPVFVAGIAITFVLMMIRASITGQSKPPHNPIAEAFSSATPLQLIMLGLLATIWAPIVEEAVFRGGFYRHLRGRAPVLVAAAISAVVFGFMHSYDAIMLGPVIALGFNFALMREWRGSIIASMTAHCLHNTTITLLMASFLYALR